MKQKTLIPLGISIVAHVEDLGSNKFKLDYHSVDLPVVVTIQMCKNNKLLLAYRSEIRVGGVVYTTENVLLDPVILNNSMDRHCINLYHQALEATVNQSSVAWTNWN